MLQLVKQTSPSAAIMSGFHNGPYFSDEEEAELAALLERDELIDVGLYEPEPTHGPDLDEGDGPDALTLGDYWPAPEDPEAL